MILATNPYLFFSLSLPSPPLIEKSNSPTGKISRMKRVTKRVTQFSYAIVWRDESVEKTIITITERGAYG